MNKPKFHDQESLADTATQLGQQALAQGLIDSFVVRHFRDSRQFYIPNENESEPLTPEEAYLYLQRMVDQASRT